LYQFFKVPTVIDEDIVANHATGWLSGALLCTPTTLDFLAIDQTNIVCFESHVMCGLGLPPSKFIVSVLNYIGCELCKCWLGIPLDTSLFWYFYSPTKYEHKVFSGIGLMLCRNRR
jgi:hypothetical protein